MYYSFVLEYTITYVCMCTTCVLERSEQDFKSPGTEITHGWELAHEC